jgi:hypothetical protein
MALPVRFQCTPATALPIPSLCGESTGSYSRNPFLSSLRVGVRGEVIYDEWATGPSPSFCMARTGATICLSRENYRRPIAPSAARLDTT